jgi:hypothetical protein
VSRPFEVGGSGVAFACHNPPKTYKLAWFAPAQAAKKCRGDGAAPDNSFTADLQCHVRILKNGIQLNWHIALLLQAKNLALIRNTDK